VSLSYSFRTCNSFFFSFVLFVFSLFLLVVVRFLLVPFTQGPTKISVDFTMYAKLWRGFLESLWPKIMILCRLFRKL
jgi:hypothetical protein